MTTPIYDADALVLQGWINMESIIPPSGQSELRESVQRVLLKLDKQRGKIERLTAVIDAYQKVLTAYRCGGRPGRTPDKALDIIAEYKAAAAEGGEQ